MSDDSFSIGRVGGSRRPTYVDDSSPAQEAQRPVSVRGVNVASRQPIPGMVETAEALLSELGGSVDLRLFERMNGRLVSPAIASTTHRVNLLYTVGDWLRAQQSRLAEAGQGASGAGATQSLPWLESVVDILSQEAELIKQLHQGTLADAEGQVD